MSAAMSAAIALAGCRSEGRTTTCAHPLVVATWNVRFDNPEDGVHRWANRAAALGEHARALEADILGMQEVLPEQLDDLERMLPGYRREGQGRDGPLQGEASPRR